MNCLVKFLRQLARALFLKKRIRSVPHDTKQPCAGVPFLIAAEKAHCAETGLLNDVFCILRTSDEPAREVVGRVQVRQHNVLEARSARSTVCFLLHAAIKPLNIQTRYRAFLFPERSHFLPSGVYQTM